LSGRRQIAMARHDGDMPNVEGKGRALARPA
jgi:hypothetical protein